MCGDDDIFTQYDNQVVIMEVVFEEVYIDNVFLCQVIVYNNENRILYITMTQ